MGLYQPGQQPVKDAVGNSIRVSTHSLSQPAGSSPYKTFLPFSDGPRSCVGQVGAEMMTMVYSCRATNVAKH